MSEQPVNQYMTPDRVHELNIAIYKGLLDRMLNRQGGIQQLALLGLNALILLNGGAVIALYTVLGHLIDRGYRLTSLVDAFGYFIAGLCSAMLAILFGYFGQNSLMMAEAQAAVDVISCYVANKPIAPRKWLWLNVFGVGAPALAAVASLILFACGSSVALNRVSAVQTPTAPTAATAH